MDRKKIKGKSSPWMRPEVDMHAGKKAVLKPHAGCGDMCRDSCARWKKNQSSGIDMYNKDVGKKFMK
jgi:hypothetical protein